MRTIIDDDVGSHDFLYTACGGLPRLGRAPATCRGDRDACVSYPVRPLGT